MPETLLQMILVIRHDWSGLMSVVPIRVASLDDAERIRAALRRRIATHELN